MKNKNNLDLIEQYISRIEKVGKKKSKNTLINYKSDLVEFNKFIKEMEKEITEIERKDIENFQISLVDKNRAVRTIARKLTAIRMFYKYLTDVEIIERDPSEKVEVPEEKYRKPNYMTIEEATRVIKATDEQEEPYRSRDRLILTIAFTTGLRAEEITNIKLKDIKESTLTVIGKGDKQRDVMLNSDTLTAIENYHKVRNNVTEYLFVSARNTHMSKRTIQYTVDKYIRLAGLDTSLYSTHSTRHTSATIMHKNGVSIRALQEILGHANVSTTEMYTHVDTEQKQSAANVMDGMFS